MNNCERQTDVKVKVFNSLGDILYSGLLIFRAVADLRNSGFSAKSREIHKKTWNTTKSARSISKYMSAKHISYLSWLLDLFYSPQTSKFILKLRHCNEQTSQNYQAFLDKRCEKLGTNHNLDSFSIRSFSGELLFKKANYPVKKKTLNNAGHIDKKIELILAKFAPKKIQRNRLFFTDCFLAKFPPPKFPVKSADFSKNLPLKILRNLNFSAKIPWNQPIFPRICPWKSREILIFFLRNIRSPVYYCIWSTGMLYLINVLILSLLMDVTSMAVFPSLYITTIAYSTPLRCIHLQNEQLKNTTVELPLSRQPLGYRQVDAHMQWWLITQQRFVTN